MGKYFFRLQKKRKGWKEKKIYCRFNYNSKGSKEDDPIGNNIGRWTSRRLASKGSMDEKVEAYNHMTTKEYMERGDKGNITNNPKS